MEKWKPKDGGDRMLSYAYFMFLCGSLLGLGGLFPLLLLQIVHIDLDNVGVLDHKPIQILGLHLYFMRKER
jgi:hypothetical protein